MKKAALPSWAALALLCLLAGCGFHSVYGSHSSREGTPVSAGLNQVSIDSIPDRNGQIMRNELIDKMYGKGRPSLPLYVLSIKLHSTEEDLGIQEDATSSRTLMNMYGDYVLKDLKGKVLLSGTGHSVTSFSKLNDQYGTLAAREDALGRTIDEVSEQIVTRLSLYFSEKSDKADAAAIDKSVTH